MPDFGHPQKSMFHTRNFLEFLICYYMYLKKTNKSGFIFLAISVTSNLILTGLSLKLHQGKNLNLAHSKYFSWGISVI